MRRETERNPFIVSLRIYVHTLVIRMTTHLVFGVGLLIKYGLYRQTLLTD